MNNSNISQPRSLSRAVLWDLDGTLIDSNTYHYLAWRDEIAARGREMSRAEFLATFGQRNDTILRLWLGAQLSDQEVEQIAASKEARYRDLVRAEGLRLLPGVKDWMLRLKAEGWQQALGTMTGRENIETIFSSLAACDGFDPALLNAVVTGDEVAHGKPDPQVWLLAAERLGVSPARCVVIEDSPAGIEAARRAGMRAIGVGQATNLSAEIVVSTLADLPCGALDALLSA